MLKSFDLYQEMVKHGENWAEKQAVAELLEDTTKSLLSQLGLQCEDKSNAAKEAFALRHPDYKKHVESKVDARKAANKGKVQYDSFKIYTELLRTESANERAANRSAT